MRSDNELVAVHAIPISHEIPRHIMTAGGVDNLLRRSGRRGTLGHIEMQHLATTMFQHDKHEQHLDRDRGNGEEVNRGDLAEVVMKRHLPRVLLQKC